MNRADRFPLKRRGVAHNAAWVMAGQTASILLQTISFVLIARLLGSTQYGIFMGAAALVAIVGQFSTLGSGMVFLRHVSQQHRRYAEYWGNILLTTLVAGSACILLLRLIGYRLIGPAGASLLLMISIGDFLGTRLLECAGQVFQAFERLEGTAALNTATNLLRCLAALLLFLSGRPISARQWALVSMLISLAAAAGAVTVICLRFGMPVFRRHLVRSSAAEGLSYSVAYSTTSIYNDVDKTMLSHYGMYAANGAYTLAYRVVDVSTMPIRALHAAALPRFFQHGAEGVKPAAGFAIRLLKRTLPAGLAVGIATWSLATWIPRILGPSFAPSVHALRWLAILPLIRCLHLSAGDALTGSGHQNYRTGAQLTAALLNFLVNLWLIPAYGWLGAAWSSVATDATLAASNWLAIRFLLGASRTASPLRLTSET
jgi:O-antigen/teichoic acid export membrane protein